jgi:hypothetical protein
MTDFDAEAAQPVHNPALHRFEIALPDGQVAVVDYAVQGATLTIHHTGVPTAYEGRGLAAKLNKATLEWAKAEGYHVRALCSYTQAYVRRHPELLAD